ncbi:MAG: hypothetical protein WDN45_18050 [Caulobacteraceae bacterium]
MRSGFARSRDRLEAGLKAEGFAVLPSQGTYFLLLDLEGLGRRPGRRDLRRAGRARSGGWRRSRCRLSTRRTR